MEEESTPERPPTNDDVFVAAVALNRAEARLLDLTADGVITLGE